MSKKAKLAVAGAIIAGIATLGAAPAAHAYSRIGKHTQQIVGHAQRVEGHADRVVDRAVYETLGDVVDVVDAVDISVEDVGDTINETGKFFNRTMQRTLNPR